MNIPKLSPKQWFQLVSSLLPFIRGLVRVAGIGVVGVIRALIDLCAQVESLYPADPADIDPATGKPRKRGSEKAQAFAELVTAAFATADESAAAVQARIGDIGQMGTVLAGLFSAWGFFKSEGNANA